MPSVVEGRSSLPFARLQTFKTSKTLRGSFDQALRPLPSVVQGVQACRLKPKTPKTLRGSLDQALRPLPSVVKGIQGCRLPRFRRLTRLKPSAAASRQLRPGTRVKGVQACCLPGFKRLKPLKPSAAASTRHSSPCPLLLKAFKPAVCQASNA